ncbi:HAMP domain-containing histidine kinase [Denitromonas halophila]|uniref:histidine kinase n=2 Tax=Denitromonas halophila TaxID=1629404 RepID=A0A557QSM3_9RHOO|nr:HAMP domain-containing histidine kinase [Denitromonas halophila]
MSVWRIASSSSTMRICVILRTPGSCGAARPNCSSCDQHYPCQQPRTGRRHAAMKLANRILAITFLISTTAIVGIAGLTLAVSNGALHDLLRKSLSDTVGREARVVQNSVDMVKSDLVVLAEVAASGILDDHSDPSAGSLQMLTDHLNALMRKRPAYAQAQLILGGATGQRMVLSTRSEDAGQTTVGAPTGGLRYEAVLREKQGLRPWSAQFGAAPRTSKGKEAAEGRDVLYFSAPVVARGGATVGAVAIAADFDLMVRELGWTSEDVVYSVGDQTGRYLYRSRPPPAASDGAKGNMLDDFPLRNGWGKWLAQGEPHLQRELRDPPRVVDLRRVDLVDATSAAPPEILVVGGVASFANVEMKASMYRTQLAVTVLGIGTLMVLGLTFATFCLVRPIESLTTVVDRIAAGEQNVMAPTQRRDEIGILARAMMHMADQLRRTAKNSEQAAMGRMASMIAHDLRNALSSVKMNLHILQAHHRKQNDDCLDGCEIALDQVRYMEHILNDMLAFARPGTLDLDWVDLGEAISTASVSLLPDAMRKSIDVRNCSEHKLPTVRGDRNKLLQLFQNILDNAIQAAPEGGHITIETRVLLHDSQPAVEVKVTDNGPGISPEIAGEMFEPFVTTRARGTGLGLAIVQRIVTQHRGHVTLNSRPSGGAVATVLLPVSPNDAEPADGASLDPGVASQGM